MRAHFADESRSIGAGARDLRESHWGWDSKRQVNVSAARVIAIHRSRGFPLLFASLSSPGFDRVIFRGLPPLSFYLQLFKLHAAKGTWSRLFFFLYSLLSKQ